jgi:hypothetical protein
VRFIIDLLCQADKLESDFLFVNYHQDIIVGLFESLFKAAMTSDCFDDIVSSRGVQAVLSLLQRRVRCASLFAVLSRRFHAPQLLSDYPSALPSSMSAEEQQRLSAQRAQRCVTYRPVFHKPLPQRSFSPPFPSAK